MYGYRALHKTWPICTLWQQTSFFMLESADRQTHNETCQALSVVQNMLFWYTTYHHTYICPQEQRNGEWENLNTASGCINAPSRRFISPRFEFPFQPSVSVACFPCNMKRKRPQDVEQNEGDILWDVYLRLYRQPWFLISQAHYFSYFPHFYIYVITRRLKILSNNRVFSSKLPMKLWSIVCSSAFVDICGTGYYIHFSLYTLGSDLPFYPGVLVLTVGFWQTFSRWPLFQLGPSLLLKIPLLSIHSLPVPVLGFCRRTNQAHASLLFRPQQSHEKVPCVCVTNGDRVAVHFHLHFLEK